MTNDNVFNSLNNNYNCNPTGTTATTEQMILDSEKIRLVQMTY